MKSKFFLIVFAFVCLTLTFFLSCKEEDPLLIIGNIEGTVVDAETNQPLNSVNVSLTSNSNTSFTEQSKFTGSDGKFSFKDLEAGSYKLNFTKEGYEVNHKNITITAGQTSSGDIVMNSIKPMLNVSSTQIDFGLTTNSLPLQLTNAGKGTLQWTIVNSLPWVSINPTSGNITTQSVAVTVTIDRSGLGPGPKTGTFIINSNGGSATIVITMMVPGPFMDINPLSLDFGEVETEKNLQISNSGGVGSVSYQASAAQSWISISSANGSVSSDIKTINVTVNRAGLASGSYNGTIVVNSNSNSVSVPVTMAVIQPSIPDVLNGTASGINFSSAQVSGNIISLGSSAVTQHGHCWSISSNPSIADNKTQLGGTSVTGSFSSTISGLNPNTVYYIKAYATNAVGTKYSDQITFTTLSPPTLPTVQTIGFENVTYSQALIKGNLTALGDGLVTSHGFCYSQSNPSPTTSDSKVNLGSTSQTGQYSGTITSLNPMTKYYVCAYATNSMGTAYGNVIEITTTQAPPVVTNGLLAYYTFDNQNADDYFSLHNGIAQGLIFSSDHPGNFGYSAQFDGLSSFINIPNVIYPQNIKTFSFNTWVKSSSSGADLYSQESAYYIFINENSKLEVQSKQFDLSLTSTLLNNQWHMLTYIRNNDVHTYYIDGILQETKTGPIGGFAGNSCKVGTNYNATNYFFQGKLDNLRFYNRVLSANEINEIFNAQQ